MGPQVPSYISSVPFTAKMHSFSAALHIHQFIIPGRMSLILLLSLSLQDEKMNVEALSRAELLTLLSILEGELEAQDVVIHALRVS